MPAVVSRYIETNDLNEVLNEQRNIMLKYREDIVKYIDRDKLHIKSIFDNIPSELNKTRGEYKWLKGFQLYYKLIIFSNTILSTYNIISFRLFSKHSINSTLKSFSSKSHIQPDGFAFLSPKFSTIK